MSAGKSSHVRPFKVRPFKVRPESANHAVIFAVRADPEPQDAVVDGHRNGAVITSDACGRVSVGAFKVKRRMGRVGSQ